MGHGFRRLALATALALGFGAAHANVITQTHEITASGAGTIGYSYFSLDAADTVQVYTEGPTIDSVLYLLRDDGNLTADDFIAFDDDSCPQYLCGTSGGGWGNALITYSLPAGHYVTAVGDYALSLASVVNGVNAENNAFGVLTGNVDVVINARSTVVAFAPAQLPEPDSLALLGLGLVLLPFAMKRFDARH